VIALFSLNINAQKDLNTDELIGWWMPDQDSAQLFFWKDVKGNLQVQQISNVSGSPLVLRDFRVNLESVFIKSTLPETNYTTLNYFVFIDKLNLECESTDVSTKVTKKITYSKIK
jgi:hypothetical protein